MQITRRWRRLGLAIVLSGSVAGDIGCDPGASAACSDHTERGDCESQAGCEFEEGREILYDGQTCSFAEKAGQGICFEQGNFAFQGESGTKVHVETDRLFSFGGRPAPLEGWSACECSGTEPAACACSEACGDWYESG